MSKKPATQTKAKPAAKNASAEKARKQAKAEIDQRIEALDAPAGDAAAPAEAKAKPAKAAKAPKAPKAAKATKAPTKPKKVSGLDAVAMVLKGAGVPLNMKAIYAEITKKGLWTSNGSTPEATLYAAVIREIAAKGKDARFTKADRGLFAARTLGAKP